MVVHFSKCFHWIPGPSKHGKRGIYHFARYVRLGVIVDSLLFMFIYAPFTHFYPIFTHFEPNGVKILSNRVSEGSKNARNELYRVEN